MDYSKNPFLWYVDVKDEHLAELLADRVETLDGYNINVHIYENTAWNFDLIISSKISSKQRGRENIAKEQLFKYLNLLADAFKMANE